MPELLHGWALATAAIGTCCLAADRRRARAPELAASVLMLLAMLDASRPAPLLAPVIWAAMLLIAAMALAAVRRSRSDAADRIMRSRGARAMHLHTTLGLVLMAALLLGMPHSGVDGGHAHGGVSAGALLAGLAVVSGGYALVSAIAAAGTRPWRDRAQFGAMGLSILLMSSASIV